MNIDILPGRNFPIGATVYEDGINFSVFSKCAADMELLLFDDADDASPAGIIQLDAKKTRHFITGMFFCRG